MTDYHPIDDELQPAQPKPEPSDDWVEINGGGVVTQDQVDEINRRHPKPDRAKAEIARLTKERDDYRHKGAAHIRLLAVNNDELRAEIARLREDAESWKYAFAAQSRKLQYVLDVPGVREGLAALAALKPDTGE